MKETKVDDYLEELQKQFPDIPQRELKRILVYGWKMILQYIKNGQSISITSNSFFMHIGHLTTDALVNFNTYCKKLANRISYMFRRTKSKWDGYYYFTRTENQYKEYLLQNKKKYKIFKNVILYKIFDVARLKDHSNPYIFRIPSEYIYTKSKYLEEFRTNKAEFIGQRDPVNMQDILVTNNKYKYI